VFEDQTVELLPERASLCTWGGSGSSGHSTVIVIAIAVNVGNVDLGGHQTNEAIAIAVAVVGGDVSRAG
jgi:hypothetical protein